MAKVTIEIEDTKDGINVLCDFSPPVFKGCTKTMAQDLAYKLLVALGRKDDEILLECVFGDEEEE